MFQSIDVFKGAMAMARHAGEAQALSAQNIANADTPGYRAKHLAPFKDVYRFADNTQRATRDAHLNGSSQSVARTMDTTDQMDPNENTVSLELEMIQAVEAKRQHDRALAIYRSSLNLLRASLGKS